METEKETVTQTVTAPEDYIVEKITAGVSLESLREEITGRMTAVRTTETSATHWTYCLGPGGLAAQRRIPALSVMATVTKTLTVSMDSNVGATIARSTFHMLETWMTAVNQNITDTSILN